MAREYIRMANVLWDDNIHIQCTYSEKISDLGVHLYKLIDHGRDLTHPGQYTHKAVAEHLASLLQAQGLQK